MKLLEHYGFEIGESTIQRVALGHAKTVFEAGGVSQDFPQTVGRHTEIVAQTDGGMIPIVEPDASQKDKRKGKTLSWREAKICLAHAKGSQTPVYDGTIEGGVETAGKNFCMRGPGRLRRDLPRPRGRGRSALDRRPSGGTLWRAGQLLD